MNNTISIVIAEDHVLVRDAWVFLLNSIPGFKVIGETGDGNEATELARVLRPDVLILDINLKGKSGIDSVPLILHHSPRTRVLGVSWLTHPAYSRKMIQHGALGYVSKNSPSEEMIKPIREINEGRKYICEETTRMYETMMNERSQDKGIHSLSQREAEVVEQIKKGYSSKEIAETLNISRKTIEVHRYNIMKKLNIRNVASLINYVNEQQFDLDQRFISGDRSTPN